MSMKKLNVSDAAEFFGISKEAIHNRIRRGSLESVVENGVKLVLINDDSHAKTPRRTVRAKARPQNDERYYKLLQEQNEKLQSRVEILESETKTLREQKELMLIQERQKIEQIYKEKDEQLKNVLNTLATQFMLSTPQVEAVEEVEVVEIEPQKDTAPISLKKYLKTLDLSEKKREKIKARFSKKAKKDERIITIGSKFYVDPSTYNYSDILK